MIARRFSIISDAPKYKKKSKIFNNTTMSNLAKLEFVALDITGKNYMSWTLDVEMHLESLGLSDIIKEINISTSQDKANAMIFLRRHLDEGLKCEYLTEKDTMILWKGLKKRFEHIREVILPTARDEWNTLRFQDFKKVSDYNSTMYRIVSQLKFCVLEVTEMEMLEKIFFTFHASNITLQQQYRVRGFMRYFELIACLLVAEKNNELLIRNHQSRPTGSTAFPEANIVMKNENQNQRHRTDFGRGRGRGRGRKNDRDRGRGRGYENNRDSYFNNSSQKNVTNHPPKRQHKNTSENENHSKRTESVCYRCGTPGHWSHMSNP
ncbi:uncharacterized protein [Henckelia pumila]|uniref:uncharacterized protein n=1 Tax=Henckelia pumila TaxID=405737 RepID=UPI003C6E93F8